MEDLWAAASSAQSRAALIRLAERAEQLAFELDAIAQVSVWQTAAAEQFRAEMAELAASVRRWQGAALHLSAEMSGTAPEIAWWGG